MRLPTIDAQARHLLLCGLLLLLGLAGALPDPASARGPTVYGALQSLQRTGALSAAAYGEDASIYTAALNTVKRLSGTRRAELASVIANVQQIAAAAELIPSRLPALMLTLESNVQWWSREPLLSADQRVSLPGSHLVWEHYPGQGIEIQWLATFGEANGYYDNGHENTQLRELLDEAIPLATQRAGGIAWEYFFHFDGGAPPWTSGLSQGTALQALARAYSRLKEPAYLTAAKQALGIFQTAPPAGVRVARPAGTLYAEYTYAPTDRILNGFIQALNGLYEYAKLTGDPLGRQLFEAGDAEARAITPSYDTGAWSKYDQYTESDLNYHELLEEFLQGLCTRTSLGEPGAPPPATPTPPSPPTGAATTGATAPGASTTGASTTSTPGATGGATASAAQASAAIPGDQVYCATAERFTADLHMPPALTLLTHKLPEGVRGGVQLSLSKVSTVSLTVSRGGKALWTNTALVEGGKPRLLWVTPKRPGTYSVSISAVDLAGNRASTSGTIALAAGGRDPHPPKPPPKTSRAKRR